MTTPAAPTTALTAPKGEPLDTVLTRMTGLDAKTVARGIAEYTRFLQVDAAMGQKAEPPAPLAQLRGWHLDGVTGKVTPVTDAYAATLDKYRIMFGSEPPTDIWPSLAQMQKWKRWGKITLYSIVAGIVSIIASVVIDHWVVALVQLGATVGFFWGLSSWLRKRPVSFAPKSNSTASDDAMERHMHQMAMDSNRMDN